MPPDADVPVYSLDDAVAALQAASSHGTPKPPVVRLRFPFDAAASLGPDVLCQIVRLARSHVPGVAFDWLVECGEEPGMALAMLRAGAPRLQYEGPEALHTALNDIARQCGAVIERKTPVATQQRAL